MRLGKLDANLYKGGTDKVLFVGSMTDAWAEGVPDDIIIPVLEYCRNFPENTYLFQSKRPLGFEKFRELFPPKTILGTTIESNWAGEYSSAPAPSERALSLLKLAGFPKMVSVEPIMRFNLAIMIMWLRQIAPDFISIGADSKGNDLPEPLPSTVNQLILSCSEFTTVRIKPNLRRLGVAESLMAGA